MQFTKKLFGTFASILFVTACTDTGTSTSSLTGDHQGSGVQSGDCTLTQGYWKNHADAWPVSSLKLGNVTYTKEALLEILRTPVKGNGLISLAHQLIAAKLNIAAGASDSAIDDAIDAADALIGNLVVGTDSLSTSATSSLVGQLDAYNNGETGPGHCGDQPPTCSGSGGDCEGSGSGSGSGSDCDQPPAPVCGNGTVESGEGCDDGNAIAHDGCSATCQIELPVCGNGYVEAGEDCDDGNVVSGDGCSSSCVCDCPVH